MGQAARLREIVAILEARKHPVRREVLLHELGVSYATFKRDLEVLLHELGDSDTLAPITPSIATSALWTWPAQASHVIPPIASVARAFSLPGAEGVDAVAAAAVGESVSVIPATMYGNAIASTAIAVAARSGSRAAMESTIA